MSQHDFNIANQGFPATRADINNAFQAIASNSSGPTAPSTTYANQWWYDTTNNKMYLRNAADSAWIEVAVIDQTNNEWKITSGVIQAVDGDGIVLKTDDGNTRFTLDDTGNVTFAEGTDIITGSAGTDNVRVGAGAGDSIASGGNYNVLVGTDAGTAISTGLRNTALGNIALTTNSTGNDNTALGNSALEVSTIGSDNTAVGSFASGSNVDGENNVAVGRSALAINISADNNTAVGYQALNNTTSANNTAVGSRAGYANTSGTRMTAFGDGAADANTTGNDTVAFGRNALSSNTVGIGNTAVGTNALVLNTSDNYNTALGSFALESNTGGSNTCVGYEAGNLITTGSKNTILGRYNGNQGGLDIRTSSNNIVLSDGDGNPRVIVDQNGTLAMTTTSRVATFKTNNSGGSQDVVNIGNLANAGYNAIRFWNQGPFTGSVIGSISCTTSSTSYNTSSDYRLKENVVELTGATDRLKQLEPKRFNFIADADTTVDGFLAHEVQTVVPEAITGTHNEVDDEGNPVYQGIDQSKLVPLLVATIKELEARITALEAN